MSENLIYYLNQIPAERVCENRLWLSVGNIIYDITQGSEEGYDIWLRFSKQDKENYSKDLCDIMWETYKKKNNFDDGNNYNNGIIPLPDDW